MPLPSAAIANYFLELGKRDSVPITPLKLQKLVYFAHGWYLGFTGEPLVSDRIQAWKFGPVIPSLYHEFKEYGNSPIPRYTQGFLVEDLKSPEMTAAKGLLDKVWSVYSRYTPSQLSALSHGDNGPWHHTISQIPLGLEFRNAEIPNEVLRRFFSARTRNS